MPYNISAFKSSMKFGGARNSLFEVTLTNPIASGSDNILPLRAKGASIPGSTINPIEVFYFGRPTKFSGNRTFEELTLTILNDEDFKVRNELEAWSNAINRLGENVRGLPTSEHSLYSSTAEVHQMSQSGRKLRSYKFINIWPSVIAPIELNWETEAVQEYQVTFQYDYYFVAEGGLTGNGGGQ